MKLKIIFILFLVSEITANAQLAFRISNGGLEKPSYLFGTVHLLPGSHLVDCPAFQEAESYCQQLFVETDILNNKIKNNNVEYVQQELTLPDSLTIFDVMGTERMRLLQNRLQENHINLNDSTSKSLWRMKPVFFTTILNSVITIEALRQYPSLLPSSATELMDASAISRAKEHGWEIGELDQITKEQAQNNIKKLSNNSSIEEQADSLMELVNHYDERKEKTMKESEMLPKMIDSWKKGDYQGFESHTKETVEKESIILAERNKKWLPIMKEAMKEKPTIFVFGALHLIGADGIVCLLRDAGYTVEQINIK